MRYVLIALTPMLTTTALYRSSLAWFEACSWKPTPKGLPSSHRQLRAQFVRSFSTFLFCAPAAHSQCPSESGRRGSRRRDGSDRRSSRSPHATATDRVSFSKVRRETRATQVISGCHSGSDVVRRPRPIVPVHIPLNASYNIEIT